jgi:predicted aldo/keto reductase-like oxidoreductase
MPCPNGVGIPQVFELYNEVIVYGTVVRSRMSYSNTIFFKEEQREDNCIQCDICLEKRPQQIEISDWLTKAHEFLIAKQ